MANLWMDVAQKFNFFEFPLKNNQLVGRIPKKSELHLINDLDVWKIDPLHF